jgi:hypothetical protein
MARPVYETSPRGIAAKQRYNEALDLRLAGYTYREIEEATGIDPSNFGKFLKNYLNPELDGKRQQLFNEKDAMLRNLYRMAYESASKFIPVLSADGTPVMHPLFDRNGNPVVDENGQPVQVVMRDEGAMLNALASASKIAAQLIALHGLNAPVKTAVSMTSEGPDVITFRIVEANGGVATIPEPLAPMPATIEGTGEPVLDDQ